MGQIFAPFKFDTVQSRYHFYYLIKSPSKILFLFSNAAKTLVWGNGKSGKNIICEP